MKSIVKHTLKNATKNKAQAAVIVLTIVLVAALLFAAFSLSDVFYAMNSIEQRRIAANTDMLLGSPHYYGQTFEREKVEALINKQDVAYVDYYFRTGTVVKTESLSKSIILESTNLNDYLSRYKLDYLSSFYGQTSLPAALVGKSFAQSANLKAGDEIEIYLSWGKSYQRFVISHICDHTGIFASSLGMNILTDFSAVYGDKYINSAYIKFTNPSFFEKYEAIFNLNFPDIPLSDAKVDKEALTVAKNNTMLMAVAVTFIVAAMMLILLTSYLIIARHRMGDMIIFKSAGATPKQVAAIMLLEVFIYAFFGACLGLGLGRLFMHIAVNRLLSNGSFIFSYQLWKYALSFVISVSMCLTACLIPLIKASKKTVRQLSSSPQKVAKKPSPLTAAASFALIAAVIAACVHLSGIYLIALIALFIGACALFISAAVPLAVKFVSFICCKVKKTGMLFLAAKSTKRGKGLCAITVLLVAAIVFSFAVFEVVNIIKIATTPSLSRFVADYVVFSEGSGAGKDEANSQFLKLEGIKDSGYFAHSVFLLPNSDKTFGLNGVSGDWALLHSTRDGLSKGTLERWSETENPIVLPQDMMLRYGLKIGDTVSYESLNYNYEGIILDFVVVGIDRTVTAWDFVGFVKFSSVGHMSYGTTYLLTAQETVDNNELFLRLRQTAESMGGMYALEYAEWSNSQHANFAGLSSILGFLQAFLFVVIIFGIINIATVTAFDRRHELALYGLSGATPRGYAKLSLFEGLLLSASGATISAALCFGANLLLPRVATLIDTFLPLKLFPASITLILPTTTALFVFVHFFISIFNKTRPASINAKFNN